MVRRNKGSDVSYDLAKWEQLWEIGGWIRKEVDRSADRDSRPRDRVHGEIRRWRARLEGHVTGGIGLGFWADFESL